MMLSTEELETMTTELKPSITITVPTAMLQISGATPSARTAISSS